MIKNLLVESDIAMRQTGLTRCRHATFSIIVTTNLLLELLLSDWEDEPISRYAVRFELDNKILQGVFLDNLDQLSVFVNVLVFAAIAPGGVSAFAGAG